MSVFNAEDPDNGHELQIVEDYQNPFAVTDSEKKIIHKHRLQLALYCLALEESENKKPESSRRKILPPAIHIAASGRVVRMTDEQYRTALKDLQNLIQWAGEISAVGENATPPQRLPMEEIETCKQCPFFNGNIRLCGPQGIKLGPA